MTQAFKTPLVTALLIAAAAIPTACALAQGKPVAAEAPSPNQIVDAAPASDWKEIAPTDLMVMDLAPDAAAKPRRVVIQLMPPPFSQGWIGNIRKLVAARFWDDTSVYRVQDNYVAQWGDVTEKKAFPDGLAVVPESEYVVTGKDIANWQRFKDLTYPKGMVASYAAFDRGWPIIAEGTPDSVTRWPTHCYGMVGVGRDLSPNTGNGAELYAVIGHAPRHLDRNIALVGRVIEGMEYLSSLPRGHGELGFYADGETPTPITSVRLASELSAAERPRFAYLDTDGAAFARYADARANRRDAFFIRPAGGADICNIPVPVRAYPLVSAVK